jgi:putative ABC transport system substrate-binding protein
LNADIASKRLGLLHELVPAAARFARLRVANNLPNPAHITDLQARASTIGWQLEVINVLGTIRDIETAFATIVQKRVDALLVDPNSSFYALREHLVTLATRHAIPAIYWDRSLPEAGGLMSYGSSVTDQFRQVGIYTGRILKGEKPADLPVQQATKFEFVSSTSRPSRRSASPCRRRCSPSPTR